jgi:nicotinamide riboside kinase
VTGRPLKVLITGAFSTGKSELVSNLAVELDKDGISVTLLSDVARGCPLPLNDEQTDETSVWLAMTQVAREMLAAAENKEIILCDRGIPDILAHQEHAYGLAPILRLGTLRPFLVEWCSTYDIILATKVDETLPVVADGIRVESNEYRRLLGDRSEAILRSVGHSVVLPNNLKERLVYALAAIRATRVADVGSN